MRAFCVILLLYIFPSCSHEKINQQITVRYRNNSILVNLKNNQDSIKVPFLPIELLRGETPAYCIDSTKNSIFIYVPSFGIKNYDLSSKRLINENQLEYRYHKRNHSFKLVILNDYIVFSSYLQVLIFSKDLQLRADIRDTIENNLCSEFALHKYNIEFNNDTLLFKAMFVEKYDFEKNKRYKRIFKDYEFILGKNKIECNNCDKCKSRNSLTKNQMEQLLKDTSVVHSVP